MGYIQQGNFYIGLKGKKSTYKGNENARMRVRGIMSDLSTPIHRPEKKTKQKGREEKSATHAADMEKREWVGRRDHRTLSDSSRMAQDGFGRVG